MTFKLAFTRENLALFLNAELWLGGEAREKARILKEAGVGTMVLARALSGEGWISSEAEGRLWLAIGINPEIRRDTRELQAFDAARRVAHERKVAA